MWAESMFFYRVRGRGVACGMGNLWPCHEGHLTCLPLATEVATSGFVAATLLETDTLLENM